MSLRGAKRRRILGCVAMHPSAARFLAALGMTMGVGMTGIGAPMQTKRMSNGGPTMRSRARLTGV